MEFPKKNEGHNPPARAFFRRSGDELDGGTPMSTSLRPLANAAVLLVSLAVLGHAHPRAAAQEVSTGDRLSLSLADDGSLGKLGLDAQELPLLNAGGFFL